MIKSIMQLQRLCSIISLTRALATSQKSSPLISSYDRLKVVMDLDECMVHSVFDEVEYRQQDVSPRIKVDTKIVGLQTFKITLDTTEFEENEQCHMHLRPFLQEYLMKVSQFADLYVYTAAMSIYAKPAIKSIDPKGILFKKQWYRDSCVNFSGFYAKSLKKVLGDLYNPKRTILVDNNMLSHFPQPENGILVRDFYTDVNDNELMQVLKVLQTLESEEDVRPYLTGKYDIKKTIADHYGV